MALTITRDKEIVAAPVLITEVDVAFDDSYPTGGEVVGVDALGVRGKVLRVFAGPRLGYFFEYDEANDKLLVYVQGAAQTNPMEEVGSTTDLASLTAVRVTILHTAS